jgi:hypothetical protein
LSTFGVELINTKPRAANLGLHIFLIGDCLGSFLAGRILNKSHKIFPMCKDTTNKTISKENPIKKGDESLKKKAKAKIIAHNFSRKLAERNPESKLIKAYEESYYCSSSYTVEGGKAHSHYCHRPFCPICQRIQTAQNVEKFLPIMKFLQREGRNFYFVTLTCRNCVTDNADELRAFIRKNNKIWSSGIRSKKRFQNLGCSGVMKKECTYHVKDKKKGVYSFHYHFHVIVDSLEAARYIVAQWKKLQGTESDSRFQKYVKVQDLENSALELFKYSSKASVSVTKSKKHKGKKTKIEKVEINYQALDVIYTAMHGMQRMSSFGKFREMIGDEALNEFRDEDLELNVEGLNVEDGVYTWYMSVKDRVADWFNMETGEALCRYEVTSKDELLQEIYLEEEKSPPDC